MKKRILMQLIILYASLLFICASWAAEPATGMWYNPARSGYGINISRLPLQGGFQLIWFTYRPNGTPTWFAGRLESTGQSGWTADMEKFICPPGTIFPTRHSIGTAEITVHTNNSLTFEWDLNANSGSPSVGSESMTFLHGGGTGGGMWFRLQPSGPPTVLTCDGFFTLDAAGSGPNTTSVATFSFYDAGGEPLWVQGIKTGDLAGAVTFDNMNMFIGSGLCPGCAGQPSTVSSPAGTLHVRHLIGGAFLPQGYADIQTNTGTTWQWGAPNNRSILTRTTTE